MRTQARMSALAACLALASASFTVPVTPHAVAGRAVEVFDSANRQVLMISPPTAGAGLTNIRTYPFVEDAEDLADELEDVFDQMGHLAGWNQLVPVQVTKSARTHVVNGRRGNVNFSTVKIDDPHNLLGNLQNAGHAHPNHAMTSVDQELLITYLQDALQQSHANEQEYVLTLSRRDMTIPEDTVRHTGLAAGAPLPGVPAIPFGGSADALVAAAAAWESSRIPNERAGSWGCRLDQLVQHYGGDLNGLIEDHDFIVTQANIDPVKDFADALARGTLTTPGDVLKEARVYLRGIAADDSLNGVIRFFRAWNLDMQVLALAPPQWLINWQGALPIVYAQQLQVDIRAERASA